MARIGLFELNAVEAVAEHRNFRKAAAALQLSPSALSHAITALEQRMGVRLFNRTTRSVSLSEAGEAFLVRVRPALREISAALEAVNAYRDTPAGTLRINTSEGAAQIIMEAIVLEFLRRHPAMKLDLVTDHALVDIVAGGFDAGIRLIESVPQDMIAMPCTSPLRFAAVATPEYFAAHGKPRVPRDLLQHRCLRLRFPSGAVYRWEFEKRGVEETVDVPGALTLDSHNLMLQAALAGAGIAFTSEFAVAPYVAAGRLVRVLEDWTPPYPGLALFYPANRHVPAGLRAFVDVVREAMRVDDPSPPHYPAPQ